jgi:inner membrane protein
VTSYGVRVFEPFSFKWYSWDIVYFVDPFIAVALVIALGIPAFSRVVRRHIGSGPARWERGAAAFALISIVFVFGIRDHQHRHVLLQLNARVYQGRPPIRASAYPYFWSPFVWKGVVETREFFDTVQVSTLHGASGPDTMRTYYKKEDTPVIVAAKKTELGRAYLDWARYPIAETQDEVPGASGYRVLFYDLRSIRRVYGVVELDRNLQVSSETLARESTLTWLLHALLRHQGN